MSKYLQKVLVGSVVATSLAMPTFAETRMEDMQYSRYMRVLDGDKMNPNYWSHWNVYSPLLQRGQGYDFIPSEGHSYEQGLNYARYPYEDVIKPQLNLDFEAFEYEREYNGARGEEYRRLTLGYNHAPYETTKLINYINIPVKGYWSGNMEKATGLSTVRANTDIKEQDVVYYFDRLKFPAGEMTGKLVLEEDARLLFNLEVATDGVLCPQDTPCVNTSTSVDMSGYGENQQQPFASWEVCEIGLFIDDKLIAEDQKVREVKHSENPFHSRVSLGLTKQVKGPYVGKVRQQIKQTLNMVAGAYDFRAAMICESHADWGQEPSARSTISDVALVIKDAKTKETIKYVPAELDVKKRPQKGNKPSLKTVTSVAKGLFTETSTDPRNFTQLDLVSEHFQDIAGGMGNDISDSTQSRRMHSKGKFYPKEVGNYEFITTTSSNVCATRWSGSNAGRSLKIGRGDEDAWCVKYRHPEVVVYVHGETPIVNEKSRNLTQPTSLSHGVFVADEKDVEFGVEFAIWAAGDLGDLSDDGFVMIADVNETYRSKLTAEQRRQKGAGHSAIATSQDFMYSSLLHDRANNDYPAGMYMTGQTDLKATQLAGVWVKGPSDDRFRPLYDYDFE